MYWNITVFENHMNQEVFIYWKIVSSVIRKVIRNFKLCDDILNKVLTNSLSHIQLLLFAISIAFKLYMWFYGFVASKYCMNVVYISQCRISVWILGGQHSRKDQRIRCHGLQLELNLWMAFILTLNKFI